MWGHGAGLSGRQILLDTLDSGFENIFLGTLLTIASGGFISLGKSQLDPSENIQFLGMD